MEFLWNEPPAFGERRNVVPGIDAVRLPLPFRLDHVNCWWLDGGAQACVQIDTGIASDKTRKLWLGAFGRDPDALLITHFHPDHSGAAGDYARRGVPLLGSEIEMRLAARICALSDDEYAALYAAWYARHGLPDAAIEAAQAMGNGYRKLVARPAGLATYRWLQAGDAVELGGRRWQVMTGHGHAPAMLMLFDEAARVLIAADQVLPTISPNVSGGPGDANGEAPFGLRESDPLARFLESLSALRALPDDTLVLPSHGVPFRGLHARIDALAQHHDERLSAVRDACEQPRTAAQLFAVLFGQRMDAQQTSFALGEALAHADHLVAKGELLRDEGDSLTRFVRADRG